MHLRRGLLQIGLVDDVVPIKYRSRFVAGDSHRNWLRDTVSHHLADGAASEIVED
jgi:hypothetical protein